MIVRAIVVLLTVHRAPAVNLSTLTSACIFTGIDLALIAIWTAITRPRDRRDHYDRTGG